MKGYCTVCGKESDRAITRILCQNCITPAPLKTRAEMTKKYMEEHPKYGSEKIGALSWAWHYLYGKDK